MHRFSLRVVIITGHAGLDINKQMTIGLIHKIDGDVMARYSTYLWFMN